MGITDAQIQVPWDHQKGLKEQEGNKKYSDSEWVGKGLGVQRHGEICPPGLTLKLEACPIAGVQFCCNKCYDLEKKKKLRKHTLVCPHDD